MKISKIYVGDDGVLCRITLSDDEAAAFYNDCFMRFAAYDKIWNEIMSVTDKKISNWKSWSYSSILPNTEYVGWTKEDSGYSLLEKIKNESDK